MVANIAQFGRGLRTVPAKVSSFWVDQIKQLKAEHRDWGAPRLTDGLVSIADLMSVDLKGVRDAGHRLFADQLVPGDPPSERWVSQWLRQAWPKIDEQERRELALVRWPESFERLLLPWDAAPAVLELLRERMRLREFTWGEWRPPVRLARWFYVVSVAATGLDFRRRHLLAFVLMGAESGLFKAELRTEVEAWLAFWGQPGLYELVAGRKLLDLSEIALMLDSSIGLDEGTT